MGSLVLRAAVDLPDLLVTKVLRDQPDQLGTLVFQDQQAIKVLQDQQVQQDLRAVRVRWASVDLWGRLD